MDEEYDLSVFPAGQAGVQQNPAVSYAVQPAAYADLPSYGNGPPTYSDATRAYFDKLNSYIGSLGSAPYGSFEWAMPQQSYTSVRPTFGKGDTGYGVFEDIDASAPITTYTSEEEYAPYITKPVEENAIYRFNVPSNKNTTTGNVSVGYNTPVLLVDNRTGQVVTGGVGFDAARQVAEQARQLSSSQGNKASWSIYTAPPGTTDPSQFTSAAVETPNKSFLSSVLTIAAPVLGGLLAGPLGLAGALGVSAPAAAAIGSALGSGILGTARGESIGNILKGAALSAAGSFAGGALGKAIGSAGGSTAAQAGTQAAGSTAANAATQGALNEIIVNAALRSGAQTAGSALGSAIGGIGTGSVPYSVNTNNLGTGSVPYSPAASIAGDAAYAGLDPIVVTALKNAGVSLGGGIGAGAGAIAGNFVDLGNGTSLDADTGQIVVTGTKIPVTETAGAAAGSTVNNIFDGVNPPEPLDTDAIEVRAKTQADIDAEKAAAASSGAAELLDPNAIEVRAKTQAQTDAENAGAAAGDIVVTAKPTTPPDTITDNVFSATPGIVDLVNVDQPSTSDGTTKSSTKSTIGKVTAGLSLLNALGKALGGSGSGTGVAGDQSLQPIFSAKLPTPGVDGALKVGGLDPQTLAARPMTDWYRFGMGPAMDIPAGTDLSGATSPYAGYGPGTLGEETFKAVSGAPAAPATGKAHGGAMGYGRGGSRESFAVEGPGTGRSDDIPAVLSDGEYVIDAETVALLGDGSSRAGAKKLDQLRVNIRKHKGRNLAKGKFSVKAKQPERYLSGGRA